jgi:hypothetical protein
MENSTIRHVTMHRSQLVSRDPHPAAAVSYSPAPPKPRLLDQFREAIRTRHYSPKTEESYVHWIKKIG